MEKEDGTFLVPSQSETERLKIMNAQTVQCRDEKECPSALAKIVINTPKGIGQCTGFLVDENTVMTNGHCLPSEYLPSFKVCKNKIKVLFPKTENEAPETLNCEVIAKYSFGKGKLDYMIFKTSTKSKRKPFKFKRKGVNEGDQLTIWTMSPVDVHNGVISKQNCRAILNTLYFQRLIQLFTHSWRWEIVLQNLAIQVLQ